MLYRATALFREQLTDQVRDTEAGLEDTTTESTRRANREREQVELEHKPTLPMVMVAGVVGLRSQLTKQVTQVVVVEMERLA